MSTPQHPASPSAAPRTGNETRSTHNESLNTTARPHAGGGAHPRDEPQLPHEIDESTHSQASASDRIDEVGKQAYDDATSPAEDTDRGPVLDAVYNDKIAPDRGAAPPRK